VDSKESIARTKKEFEKSFAQAGYYNRQTKDDRHLQMILNYMTIKESDRVLDLGTGNGYLAFPIASCYPDASVIGLDIIEDTLIRNNERALQQGISNLKFVTYDGINFPFEDKSFDVVVSRYALHHFPDIENAFREISRVLNKGGRLLVSDPTPNVEDCSRFVDKFMQMKPDAHIRFYTEHEIILAAKAYGLVKKSSFTTEIRFPRKGADQYRELLKEYNKEIIEGYQIQIIGDEIFISEKVLNVLFEKS
jgi:ubiquinone/menaquinone biosynthesis C-methylase UbiE